MPESHKFDYNITVRDRSPKSVYRITDRERFTHSRGYAAGRQSMHDKVAFFLCLIAQARKVASEESPTRVETVRIPA